MSERVESIDDLGVASYLKMHGYKVVGKKGKAVFFSVTEGDENEFDDLQTEYLNSQFHHFDHCLMSLKKMKDQMPR
jgi:hypothetical protein